MRAPAVIRRNLEINKNNGTVLKNLLANMTDNKSIVVFFVQIIFYVILLFNLIPFVTAISASVQSEVQGEGFHRLDLI